MRTRSHASPWPALLALVALAALAPRPAHAVTVSVVPGDTTVTVGTTFTVRVNTTAFSNLKAYSLIYGFNPAYLQFISATPGEVLTGSGNPYSTQVVADRAAPTDSTYYDCAELVGTTSGPGNLAYFKYKALAIGNTSLNCLRVDFRNNLNQQTLPACVAGTIHIIGVTPVEKTSWGRVRSIYK